MDINTIIDSIKFTIASSHKGRIEITDNSFLLDLLKDNSTKSRDKDTFTVSKPWKNYDEEGNEVGNKKIFEQRFPITYFIFRIVIYVIDLIIWLTYWIARKIRKLLLGGKHDKDLSLSPRFNFILFAGTIVFFLISIIYIFIFFLKSVLLFNPSGSVNEHGAITIPQPCGIEHYIYMFNTAECWANTGIKVLKGDKVKIHASGSFYSKISQINKCAIENDTLPYSRINVSSDLEFTDEDTRKLLMYKKENAKFGSLLMQIKEDWQEPLFDSDKISDSHFCLLNYIHELFTPQRKIYQLKYDKNDGFKSITVKNAGILSFAVNDIYFTEKVINSIKGNAIVQKNLEIEKIKYSKDSPSIPFDSIKIDSIQKDMWFYDNVGEILLSITVTRNDISKTESFPSTIVKTYRWIEAKVLPLSKWEVIGYMLFVLIVISIWLGFDYTLGLGIKTKNDLLNAQGR